MSCKAIADLRVNLRHKEVCKHVTELSALKPETKAEAKF